jgi:hypothetical protein
MFWRRRGDERAWHIWQRLAPYANPPKPQVTPRGESTPMLGYLQGVYLRGRRGDKATVDLGTAGVWDSWWEGMRPPSRAWVLISVHLWMPPGTHSGEPVLWIDEWHEEHPGDLPNRAARHARRLARAEQRRARRQARSQR